MDCLFVRFLICLSSPVRTEYIYTLIEKGLKEHSKHVRILMNMQDLRPYSEDLNSAD